MGAAIVLVVLALFWSLTKYLAKKLYIYHHGEKPMN